MKKEEFDNVYVCGGALIDGSHILTAAHSIKDYKPEDLRYISISVSIVVPVLECALLEGSIWNAPSNELAKICSFYKQHFFIFADQKNDVG